MKNSAKLTQVACSTFAAALILASSGVRGQNLLASSGHNILGFASGGTQSTFASGFNAVGGVAFDRAGDLFATEWLSSDNSLIIKIAPDGVQSTFASGLSGAATLAFDNTGNLFVGCTVSSSIIEITPGGVQSVFTSKNQTAIDNPVSIAFGRAGNLFVADGGSGKVLSYTPGGVESFFASGLGASAPAAVACDKAGNVYVTGNILNDPNSRGLIYKFTPSGVQSTFASGLYNPGALTVDDAGNVFVIAYAGQGGLGGRNTIYEFNPSGARTTFATANSILTSLVVQVPEPSGLALLAVGLFGIGLLHRRRP